MDVILVIAWWVGTISWLGNGLVALLLPHRWMASRFSRIRMAGLTNANVVRALGGFGTLVGIYWAIQGVQMVVRLLG